MNQKTDLRVFKTHNALVSAFMQLLTEKRFEEITVNELCDLAMVRRATFYKHFADKYEFFAFVIRTKQEEFDASSRAHLDQTQPQSLYLGIVKNTLDFVNSNKKLVQTVLESKMLPTLLDILSRQIAMDVTRKLKEDAEHGARLKASPQVMAQFFTGALLYTVKWWIAQKRLSQADLVKELTSLLEGL